VTTADRRDRLEAFYAPLASSPSAARRVGWETDAAHTLRLALIVDALEPLDLIGSILDAGCGDGALLRLLRDRGYSGSYLGEDLLPAMVDAARVRSPNERFEVRDLMSPGPQADAVVLSGALNTWQAEDQDVAARAALTTLWERARVALVLDLAVRDRHPAGPGIHPIDLGALYGHARDLGAVVTVREDVVPGEALLLMRRDRRLTLERYLPGPPHATARARMLLAAREAAAARDTLAGLSGDDADVQRALTHIALGRVRDAEQVLRRVAATGHAGARLQLGALALATGRAAEACSELVPLAQSADPAADDARLLLARHCQRAGDRDSARRWAAAIVDPLLAREAAAIADLDSQDRRR
jgi:SAM-dependent methyltransferase